MSPSHHSVLTEEEQATLVAKVLAIGEQCRKLIAIGRDPQKLFQPLCCPYLLPLVYFCLFFWQVSRLQPDKYEFFVAVVWFTSEAFMLDNLLQNSFWVPPDAR